MSCCNECEQSGGNCNQGLGDVSIVGGRVMPGSVIDWKGHILWPDASESIRWNSDAEARIKDILWAHGGFSRVDAGQVSSSIFYQWFPEISVRVTTQVEFAYLGDVYSTIEGAIWQAGYRPEVIDFSVISVPSGTSTSPQITQPGRAGGVYVPPGSTAGDGSNPNVSTECPPGYYNASYLAWLGMLDCRKLPDTAPAPDECDWNTMSWDDYIACQLGIKTKEAVIVGAVGALVGVIAISKLVK